MSKGLEALEIISNNLEELYAKNIIVYPFKVEKNNIEKELKALEIIKKKRVNSYLIIESENLKDYNECVDDTTEKRLTQEEYELLKEVLL